ncbi:cytochrome ubiquinol oxidase subunit I (plasmid) [Streptomyces sp. NBC_00536]|uniref:cytochrome ubiquinol oxidase subunit I n=1 Tax=Streptomyces sp. NBC_00536 TaxID=2975769 RepID=UPI002E801D99|nr:cytochrome ubiquinol oxidase subunit I [Streptomyces sp. NBC_00536]WUC84224.1 cytochrome ubiquinol oxidase subunit I [Streptomyces sp. NBC_00536]
MAPQDLARLQFGLTVATHYLLVTLTLGLVALVAVTHTRWVRTGDPAFRRMTTYWGTLYVINYAVGIATGLAMEFQLSANWTGLESSAASVFGAPLAVETVVSFFAESTFLALWIFGFDRLPKYVHLACIWVVAAAAYTSAVWALLANGFMQNPVAYTMRDGHLELTSFGALFSNANSWIAIFHITGGALAVGGFFVLGISLLLHRRGRADRAFVRHSLKMGAHAGTWGASLVVLSGMVQLGNTKKDQPLKGAVLDGNQAEVTRQLQELAKKFGPLEGPPSGPVLGALTLMMMIGGVLLILGIWALVSLREQRPQTPAGRAYPGQWPTGQAPRPGQWQAAPPARPVPTQVRGRKVYPGQWAPGQGLHGPTGQYGQGTGQYGQPPAQHGQYPSYGHPGQPGPYAQQAPYSHPGQGTGTPDSDADVMRSAVLRRLLPFAMVLPFVANLCGWIVREVGRQPFVITGILTTRQAMTPGLGTGRLTASLLVLVVLVVGLLGLDWWLLSRAALRGPGESGLGQGSEPATSGSTASDSLASGLAAPAHDGRHDPRVDPRTNPRAPQAGPHADPYAAPREGVHPS